MSSHLLFFTSRASWWVMFALPDEMGKGVVPVSQYTLYLAVSLDLLKTVMNRLRRGVGCLALRLVLCFWTPEAMHQWHKMLQDRSQCTLAPSVPLLVP